MSKLPILIVFLAGLAIANPCDTLNEKTPAILKKLQENDNLKVFGNSFNFKFDPKTCDFSNWKKNELGFSFYGELSQTKWGSPVKFRVNTRIEIKRSFLAKGSALIEFTVKLDTDSKKFIDFANKYYSNAKVLDKVFPQEGLLIVEHSAPEKLEYKISLKTENSEDINGVFQGFDLDFTDADLEWNYKALLDTLAVMVAGSF